MRRLWVKLALAFALVVAVSIGLVAFIISQSTSREFVAYVQIGQAYHFQMAVDHLAAFYAGNNTWNGVDSVLNDLQRMPNDHLLLADSQGIIVADTAGQLVGKQAGSLTGGLPVRVAGQQVGTFYATLPMLASGRVGQGPGLGLGPKAGLGPGPNEGGSSIPMEALEQRFLAAVNRSVWITALGALAGAILLSILLARQITGPMSAVRDAAKRIATGDLSGRVPVRSKDEAGDLAISFNAMAEALERNERARRHMVADVAHELKTPLMAIEGTAKAMLDGVFQLTPDNLQTIEDQAQILTKLVDDLRELSLAEAGQLKLECIPTDVSELVEHAIRSHEAAARKQGLQLETEVDRRLPPVLLDPKRMGEVLSNLLSNAIRHTPLGGRVGIEAREESGELVLLVWDTGEGIRAEDLPFVFDRFYRVDKSRARRSGGSGLGLAIVKQLVEAHGGRVWVESIAGQGSRFYVSIPSDNKYSTSTN